MILSKTIEDEYFLVANLLHNKHYLDLGIGSLSIKIKPDNMLINKKNKSILEEDFSINVHIFRQSIEWEESSKDVKIHAEIYKQYSNTKAIGILFLKETLKYAQNKEKITFNDYYGNKLGNIPLIEIKSIEEWEENAPFIISKKIKNHNILIIKQFAVVIKSRDIRDIAKFASILENSSYLENQQKESNVFNL